MRIPPVGRRGGRPGRGRSRGGLRRRSQGEEGGREEVIEEGYDEVIRQDRAGLVGEEFTWRSVDLRNPKIDLRLC